VTRRKVLTRNQGRANETAASKSARNSHGAAVGSHYVHDNQHTALDESEQRGARQLLLSVAILAPVLSPKVRRIHVASWNQCNACNTVGGDNRSQREWRGKNEEFFACYRWSNGIGRHSGPRIRCGYGSEGTSARASAGPDLRLDGILYRRQWRVGPEPQLLGFR